MSNNYNYFLFSKCKLRNKWLIDSNKKQQYAFISNEIEQMCYGKHTYTQNQTINCVILYENKNELQNLLKYFHEKITSDLTIAYKNVFNDFSYITFENFNHIKSISSLEQKFDLIWFTNANVVIKYLSQLPLVYYSYNLRTITTISPNKEDNNYTQEINNFFNTNPYELYVMEVKNEEN